MAALRRALISCWTVIIVISTTPASIESATHSLRDVGTLVPTLGTTADSLPPQHIFAHGRQCGLPNATTGDRIAAMAIKPRGSIAEGEVNIIVQVHFHVISGGTAVSQGNVPDRWIQNQMATLQKAHSVAGFVFVLASVSRTVNKSWYNMAQGSSAERAAKSALRKGGIKDLNVYTANIGVYNLLGWSTLPWGVSRDLVMDGIVVLWSSLPGGPQQGYNLGNTLVHESGHFFGLLHTFQGGCNVPNDYVTDTPAERSPQNGCVPTRSCSPTTWDPITNFMDYSTDACMKEFTKGQAARMLATWSQYRDPTFRLRPPSPPPSPRKPPPPRRSPPLPRKSPPLIPRSPPPTLPSPKNNNTPKQAPAAPTATPGTTQPLHAPIKWYG